MAVTLRMARYGRRNSPYYRIVAADRRFSRDGRYLEIIGTFNPESKAVTVKKEAAEKWIKVGAIVTPTVKDLLAKNGVVVSAVHNSIKTASPKKKPKKEKPKAKAATKTAAKKGTKKKG